MRFKYIAAEPSGKVQNGEMEAASSAEVLAWMASQGLKPLSVKAISSPTLTVFKGVFTQNINLEDKVFLTKYLALMMRVGTDLYRAIDILISDFDKPAVKSLLAEVKDSISKGQPFYSVFAKYPKDFNSVFVNLIKAGEASGNLEKVFEDLSKSLERDQTIKNKVKAAITYPMILVSLAFIILFLLVTFALPKLSEVFTSGGIEPPLFSRMVFGFGNFMNRFMFLILPFMIVSAIGLVVFFMNPVGKRVVNRTLIKIPVVGGVVYRVLIQRFATTLSSLIKSGMPINVALETTADAVGNEEMRAAIYRISREGIGKGLTIGEAFQRETYFPKVVVNLIAISEKAGHIETILDTLADFYESEIDTSIKTLLSMLEPALLVVIGIIVAAIALAIIMPIYQLTSSI